MMPNQHYTLSACLLALAVASPFSAIAADPAAEAGWQFEITPYLWATRMDGEVKAGRLPKTDVDMKFSDILENLDFGFMTAFEARKDRWGILFDGMYMKVSDSAGASRPGVGFSVDADARVEQSMIAAAVAYRMVEGETPVDLIAGARYNKIDVDAKIDATLFGLAGTVKRSGDKDWVDPYIGVRAFYPVNPKLTAVGYLDVGGFGVGSDFTWQGLAGLKYSVTDTIQATFGYRYMEMDYDDGGFEYDMANDGLYAGAAFHF